MLRASVRRIVSIVPTLVLVVFMSFILQAATPGDAARIIAGPLGSETEIARIRDELDLNKPLVVQFGDYIWRIVHGNLGVSALTGIRVTKTIFDAIPVTMSLVLVALSFALILALTGGVLAALRRNTWVDRVITGTAAVGLAVPAFITGVLLVLVVAVQLRWLPATGYAYLSDGFWPWLSHLILPGLALSLVSASELTRFVRSSFVDTLDRDYIRAAEAYGLSALTVVGGRAAKNAAAPVLTVFGLQVGRLLSSAVVVEGLFSIPGFGTLAFQSAINRDIPLIQGVVLVAAGFVMLMNLLTDLLYPVLNPRLRD